MYNEVIVMKSIKYSAN